MSNVELAIEAVASLDKLVDALDTLIDNQFRRIVQMEIRNGEFFADGSLKTSGVPYFFVAYDEVQKYEHNDWLDVTESNGNSVDLSPPSSNKHVPEGDGLVVGINAWGAYGANLLLPVVISPLWLDAPASFSVQGNTPMPPVPPPVQAKFNNPVPFYIWLALGGLYGPPGGQAAVPDISYCISPVNYSTNASPPKSVQTVLDSVWSEVLWNQSTGHGDEEHIGPDSDWSKASGDGSGSSPISAGFTGVTARGKAAFLDDDGNPCLPYIFVKSKLDSDAKINEVTVQIANAVGPKPLT